VQRFGNSSGAQEKDTPACFLSAFHGPAARARASDGAVARAARPVTVPYPLVKALGKEAVAVERAVAHVARDLSPGVPAAGLRVLVHIHRRAALQRLLRL